METSTGKCVIPDDSTQMSANKTVELDVETDGLEECASKLVVESERPEVEDAADICISPNANIDVKNSLGVQHDRYFVFKNCNTTFNFSKSGEPELVLKLSDKEVQAGPVHCYTSIYNDSSDISARLNLPDNEQIVSPAVEVYFPGKSHFNYCASLQLYLSDHFTNFKVWRYVQSRDSPGKFVRTELLRKEGKDRVGRNTEAYYRIISPTKIEIFGKRFCILVCSCGKEHDGFSLLGWMHIDNLPSPNTRKHIKVEAFVCDEKQYNEKRPKLDPKSHAFTREPANIYLPNRVTLDDELEINMTLLDGGERWQHIYQDHNNSFCMRNITRCQDTAPKSEPFTKEWHFQSKPVDQLPDVITFQCAIDISVVDQHPGVGCRKPPVRRFVLAYEMNIADQKKTVYANSGAPGQSHTSESIVRAETDNKYES